MASNLPVKKNIAVRYVNFMDFYDEYPDDEFSLRLFVDYLSYFLRNQLLQFTPFILDFTEEPAGFTLTAFKPEDFSAIKDQDADFTLFIHRGKLPFPAQDQFRLGFAIVEFFPYQLPQKIMDTRKIFQIMRNFSWVYCDELSHEIGHQIVLWLFPGDVAKSIDYIHIQAVATYYDDEIKEVPLLKAFNPDGTLNFSYEGLVYPVT